MSDRPEAPSRLRRALRFALSLKVKVVWMALLVAFVPLIVVWSIGGYETLMRRKIRRELDSTARELEEAVAKRELSLDTLTERRRWLKRFADRNGVMIQVIDRNGELLTRSRLQHIRGWPALGDPRRQPGFFFGRTPPDNLRAHERALPPLAEREEVMQALAGESASTWRHTKDHRMWVFYHAVPLTVEAGENQVVAADGALYLIRISWRNVRALYDFRYAFLRLTLILAGGVVLMAVWVGLRLARPIAHMQRAIRAHLENPADVSPDTIQLHRNDELGVLSRDVQSLAHSMQAQHRRAVGLAAELAHDLKNPIATVTATAEMLEARSREPGDRQARLAVALARAAEHMNRSVDGLLSLARLNHELATLRRAPVDLGQLVNGLVAAYRDDPRTEEIEISAAIADGVRVVGLAAQLETLSRNLLDNAVLYCEARVMVTLLLDHVQARLVVEDDGPGIDAGDRDKLFRLFFTARPDGLPPGSGLGLAVVHTIATAHQGEVTVDLHGELGGARFVVSLPLATG
jgi:two-component system sensor histidine kinase ChvG